MKFLAIAGLLMLPSLSLAQDAPAMRAQEQVRFDRFDGTAGRAIMDALAGGSRGDVDMLQAAMAGTPLPPLRTSLAGDWKCRTLKLGGLLPLTVYAQFDCKISQDGATYILEKTSGSQRVTGRISLLGDQMVLLGVGYVADATPPLYGDLPDGDFGDGEVQPVVGLVEQTTPNAARIMFPQPLLESNLNILFLTR